MPEANESETVRDTPGQAAVAVKAPARRRVTQRAPAEPFSRHLSNGSRRPMIPPLEPRPRRSTISAVRTPMSAPPPPPPGVDPFLRRIDPTAGTLAVDPTSPVLPEAGRGGDIFSVRVDADVPPSLGDTVTPRLPVTPTAPVVARPDPFVARIDDSAASLPVTPTAPVLARPDPFVARIDDSATSLPVTPTAPVLPAPVEESPPPAPVAPPAPPSGKDPFASFIDAGSHTVGGATPLAPLQEANRGIADDPFSSRVSPDGPITRQPATPTPETRLFQDPLSARIDPASRVDQPVPVEPDDAPTPPRFSRHVSTVAIPIRAGRALDLQTMSTKVRRERHERDSAAPGYLLGDRVRRTPQRRRAARAPMRTPHRNLLRELLTH